MSDAQATLDGNAASPAKRRLLERLLRGEGGGEASTIPRRRGLGPTPLSFSQMRLWFLDQVAPGNAFYNVPVAVPLPLSVSPSVVERCLNEIVRRHESLRTTFAVEDGRPIAVVAPRLAMPFECVSLRTLPREDRQPEARRLAAEEAKRPFDLSRGPLIRARLLDLGDEGFLLLLTLHHIVSDGWSVGLLFRELTELYVAFAAGRPSPLPTLPIQYPDFAVWQRDWLHGGILEEQLAYWRTQLQSLPKLQLQTDRPRPAVATYRGSHYPMVLPAALSDALRALGAREGTTLFMTVLAAFNCLLHRYTEQEDIVVGSPVAGRNRPETEPLIGFFVNSLVLRTPVRASEPFLSVLQRVREITLAAYAHQDVPFDTIVEMLQPERDLSRNPLFQVTFQIANTPSAGAAYNGDGDKVFAPEQGTAIFDLAFNMVDTVHGLRGQIEYSTDLFDAATIGQMLAHLEQMLEGIVADPTTPVERLPLLTALERRQLLEDWNATAADFPDRAPVHRMFEARVRATPEAVALVTDATELTYDGLNRRANQVAHWLIAQGMTADSIVALRMERSVEMVVGLLGVLKAGAAYLPLDPSYPAERLAYMVETARCAAVLTREEILSPAILGQPDVDPASSVDADDLAYVIFTSGSVGKPKGVMIPHGALTNHMLWMQQTFPLAPSDRVLQRTAFSFDASVWEFHAPLIAGARLVLSPAAANLDPELLAAAVIRHGVTTLQLVPSLLQLLVDEPDFAHCTSLRRLFCGGEALRADLVARVFDALDVEVINLYGPTETTIDATVHVCHHAESGPNVPIGVPVANTRVYVLDGQGELAPIGVAGELYIGGACLARGYLGQPELTDARFVADPFVSGQKLYRTGDRVRFRRDGTLEFLGRVDHQVKLRGFRIEPAEIECVLRLHPAVSDAVVVMADGPSGTQRLVGYVVADAVVSVSELRELLKVNVPEYMIPAALVVMDALPLTPNGKVDRHALPAPDVAPAGDDADFVAPASDVERTLARIWRSVLGIERVGANDNFFELGGDSILSIQIVSRAREAGLHLAPHHIFQHQTIAGLAAAAAVSTVIDAEQGVVSGPVPLMPIQQWFFEHESPDLHYYNQAVMAALPWRVRPETMRAAVAHAVAHHDALRTRIDPDRGQSIASAEEPIPFEHAELPNADGIEAEAGRVQASLDFEKGPIVRVALWSLPDSARLLVVVHHLVIDAVSWSVLLPDILHAYDQLTRGEAVSLPPKTTSFKRWAERCAEYAATAECAEELPVWLRVAQAEGRLPVDASEGENTMETAAVVTATLSGDLTDRLLHAVPSVYRTQINDVLLTALCQTLAAWTGRGGNLVDLEGHGREALFADIDVSRTVGWFTTICPLLLEVTDADGPARALASVKETLARLRHHGLGFGLLRYLSPDPEVREALRALPKPEISFNYLGQMGAAVEPGGGAGPASESTGPWVSTRRRRPYLIEINAAVARGRLSVHWGFSTNIHWRATIEALADGFNDRLRTIIEHCESAASDRPSDFARARLTHEELERLLTKISDAKTNTRH